MKNGSRSWGFGCEDFIRDVYQDEKLECPSCDCYVCLAKAMRYLNEEYKEPIKLTRFEYDLLDTNDQSHDRPFGSFKTYTNMIERGYFKNIKYHNMTLKEILENCIIEG